jgi:hypothetical protein
MIYIEAGILLRGNGVLHAMLVIRILLARGFPGVAVPRSSTIPSHPTPTYVSCVLHTIHTLKLISPLFSHSE